MRKPTFWQQIKGIKFITLLKFGFDNFYLSILNIEFWVTYKNEFGYSSCTGFSRALFSIEINEYFIGGTILFKYYFFKRHKLIL